MSFDKKKKAAMATIFTSDSVYWLIYIRFTSSMCAKNDIYFSSGLKRLRAYTYDKLCTNYACNTFICIIQVMLT